MFLSFLEYKIIKIIESSGDATFLYKKIIPLYDLIFLLFLLSLIENYIVYEF